MASTCVMIQANSALNSDSSMESSDFVGTTDVRAVRSPLSPAPMKKSVAFAQDDVIVHVLHISEFTPEEIQSTWYSKQELKAIKANGKTLLGKVLGGFVPTDADGSVRGLEAFTRERCVQKKQNKSNAKAIVFLEQMEQRDEGIFDPERLADAYFETTEHCLVAAQMIAVRDAFDAAHQQWNTIQRARTVHARKNANILDTGICAVAENPPDKSYHVKVSSCAA